MENWTLNTPKHARRVMKKSKSKPKDGFQPDTAAARKMSNTT